MSDAAAFRFHHSVVVRFKDIDVGGHAHHSHALVYFEEARAAYWREVVGRTGGLDDIDYILAEARVRYLQRVLWPQSLQVGVRVSVLGRKHFEMEYSARSEAGEEVLTGSTVQIMYDYDAGSTTRIPDDVRRKVEALDGPFGRRGRARSRGRE
jgi:acyl-CoA thioester hydrolase